MKKLLPLVLFLIHSYAFGCYSPPSTLYQSDRALVYRSPNIALAKVIREMTNKNRHTDFFVFSTVETIRGHPLETFSLRGYSKEKAKRGSSDFSKHQQPEFWAFATENDMNSITPGDCRAYGIFEVGKTYLIFYDKPSHIHSFEEIRSSKDLWLNVVKIIVKRLDMQYER